MHLRRFLGIEIPSQPFCLLDRTVYTLVSFRTVGEARIRRVRSMGCGLAEWECDPFDVPVRLTYFPVDSSGGVTDQLGWYEIS